MSIEKVREFFTRKGLGDKVLEFDVSSATVELAAEAIGCESERIAKSLTFMGTERPIMVVATGDSRVDNAKFKATFGIKAKMLKFDEVEELIGHAVGGVCPFCVKENVSIYLDNSLKRFETVYPACGSSNSAIELTLSQLEEFSSALGWVDVCK